jgi:hypothetical protein
MTSPEDAKIKKFLKENGRMSTLELTKAIYPDEDSWDHIAHLTHIYQRCQKLEKDKEIRKILEGRNAYWELVVA